ncbi:MAG: right-handed parallel beta-helix repeat-containing protein [Bacteroidales bacterium]|nr:right-handed parallel beta-helix repeat-containing protein [Bacteroidales bacterium]
MTIIKYFTGLLIIIPFWLYGNIIIVDQNGTGDYITIQEGINNANTGDTVLVYPGNYIEIVDFIGKDIVVASLFLTTQDTSYISQTIIDGNHENYRLVRFTNGETDNARLIGFKITNAYLGFVDKPYLWIPLGLGVYINGSSPVIENNRIINNYYGEWYCTGGGIVVENSSAKIINNIINNNDNAYHGGGIYINNSVNVLIESNSIDNNTVNSGYGVSYGAGIYIDSSHYILISNNTIRDNYNNYGYGGGIYILASDHITILNNYISNNILGGCEGGGIYTQLSSDISIIGNLFYNNCARWFGGGISCNNSEILIANNTICFNKADNSSTFGKGGGLYCYNSSPNIYNTIFFFNFAAGSGNQVYLDANSDPNFFFCNIEGGLSAFGLGDTVVYNGLYENNIETDPQFLLSGDHPYNLNASSPCINAGNPDTTGLYIPEVDLAGNMRVVQDIIDIGAYEYQFTSNITYPNPSDNILVFPNPANDKVTIRIPEIEFQKAWVTITDMKGNPVLKIQIVNPFVEYDLSSLPKGIYIIKIMSGKLIKTEKIILY